MLEKFSRAEIEAEKKEIKEKIGRYFERLAEPLEKEAERLRNLGFSVEADCRVNPAEFEDLVGEKEVVADAQKVQRLESKWQKEPSSGELLEMVKTLGINKLWFDRRLISVRTSKYDDYVNGVDNLIFDTLTGEPIAAIDDTTDVLKKDERQVLDKISGAAQVKYGIEYSKEGIEKRSYSKLPVFVISSNPENLTRLAEDVINNKESFEGVRALQELLAGLQEQYQKIEDGIIKIDDPELRASYDRAGALFREL